MKKIEEKIFRFIQQKNLIQKNDKILIALSGGPDSVFCLNFFFKYRKKYKIQISAIHVNHNLRGPDSIQDEKFCQFLCKKLDLPLFTFSDNVSDFARKHKYSIEEAGRIIRYKHFDELVKKYNFNKLVTAHTMDDNTESILLNIIKGSGINGLGGIPVKRNYIIRPLLSVTKSEILSYLRGSSWKFRLDKSNLSLDYQRNFLRLKVLPLIREINPKINEALQRLSQTSSYVSDFLDVYIKKIFRKYLKQLRKFEIPLEMLKVQNELMRSEILRRFFIDFLGIGFENQDYIKLNKLLDSQKGRVIVLKNNWKAHRESDKLVFSNKNIHSYSEKVYQINDGRIEFEQSAILLESVKKEEVNLKHDNFHEFIDADKITGQLILRNWKAGDRFTPLGMKGSKKVSDFLTDLKLNHIEKKSVHILADRNNIIWIVGIRINNNYRITEKTKNILKLSVVKNEK